VTEFLNLLVIGLVVGSTYAAIAVGFGLTFSVLGIINLAHPEFFALGMFLCITAANLSGANAVGLLLAAGLIVVGLSLTSVVLERTVLRQVRNSPPIMTLVATAGISIALQYFIQLLYGPDPRAFPRFYQSHTYSLGGVFITNRAIISVSLAIFCSLVVVCFVRYTKWGLATRAVAQNRDIAGTMGVNVVRVSQMTIALSAVIAGIAGFGVGQLYGQTTAFIGVSYGLKAFICMLVAGNKRIEGIVLVAIVLGVLESMVTAYISSSLRDVVVFGLLIAILYLRPNGLFGSYTH
jgi:branched-chain amino acid transport system permease protein